MAKKTYLHRGLVTEVEEKFAKIAGLFDLERWWRDTAKKQHVAFYDECCPEASGESQPVRAQHIGENVYQLQRFNGTEWVEI
jgi:hypothetical protein